MSLSKIGTTGDTSVLQFLLEYDSTSFKHEHPLPYNDHIRLFDSCVYGMYDINILLSVYLLAEGFS